ncbi:hypothetical protein JW949_04510 [Candidatus Woesearchaeota archaeon]|nr:hypothetical protein [Candidatus Woesearchaeota archaeon]
MPITNSRIKKIVNENQEFLSLLEELDRTGKMHKVRYKKRADFTVDEELLRKFRNYCKEHNINMSGIIENKIKEFLKENKK